MARDSKTRTRISNHILTTGELVKGRSHRRQPLTSSSPNPLNSPPGNHHSGHNTSLHGRGGSASARSSAKKAARNTTGSQNSSLRDRPAWGGRARSGNKPVELIRSKALAQHIDSQRQSLRSSLNKSSSSVSGRKNSGHKTGGSRRGSGSVNSSTRGLTKGRRKQSRKTAWDTLNDHGRSVAGSESNSNSNSERVRCEVRLEAARLFRDNPDNPEDYSDDETDKAGQAYLRLPSHDSSALSLSLNHFPTSANSQVTANQSLNGSNSNNKSKSSRSSPSRVGVPASATAIGPDPVVPYSSNAERMARLQVCIYIALLPIYICIYK